MSDAVIKFEKVSKQFGRGKKLLLKEALLDVFKPSSNEYFWALEDVSFKVKKGETLGIIGPNGSGKSTILKLIAGVMVPTRGKIHVSGRMAPLIELGAGFHPELTGRENIYINGTILGLSRKEIDLKVNEIINFAGIEDFIDTPVKHYSSGMYLRLGFSIAINTDPEILLIDEILAVGDITFREKCFQKMEEFKQSGRTIVYISHNIQDIKTFCTRGIYLDSARVVKDGAIDKVVDAYKSVVLTR